MPRRTTRGRRPSQLGELPDDALAEVLLSAAGTGGGVERVMGLAWRQGRLLRVERRAPLVSATGKILHLRAGAH